VLFPADGITKVELAAYYRDIGPAMLPHVRHRPLMLERYPDGIERHRIVQKEVPGHFPDWIDRVAVPKKGGTVTHAMADDVGSLVYLANQACIALHTWLCRADKLDRPDQVIIDLDPPADEFAPAVTGARILREVFGELGLVPFVKTTGSRGLHVVVPITRSASTGEVRAFAWDVAAVLVARDPEAFTVEARKAPREGRLYVDVLRNGWAQNAVAPYSVRPLPGAPVAAPLRWEELDEDAFHPRMHTLRTAVSRVEQSGDPWAGMARSARSLREPRRRLQRMLAGERG
jgi:bifunctional non-homologous end joining protein LigD